MLRIVLFTIFYNIYEYLYNLIYFRNHLKVSDNVVLENYMGLWYEIVRKPNNFQKPDTSSTANYTLKTDYVEVINTSYKNLVETDKIIGKAYKSSSNSK